MAKAIDELQHRVADFASAQQEVNTASKEMHAEHSGNVLLFRAVIAVLAAEATPRVRERLNALLDKPLETIQGLDPSSALAVSIQQAARYMKEELGRA
jgi:hypothetical protein